MQNTMIIYVIAYIALGGLYLLLAWVAVGLLEKRIRDEVRLEEKTILDADLPFTPSFPERTDLDRQHASEFMDRLVAQRIGEDRSGAARAG